MSTGAGKTASVSSSSPAVHMEPLQTQRWQYGPLFSALLNAGGKGCASLWMRCQLFTTTEWLNDLLKAMEHISVTKKQANLQSFCT